MSKEFNLTTQAQKPYPENGDKYMSEPGNREVKPPRITRVETSGESDAVIENTPERTQSLKKAWAASFHKSYDRLTHEERMVVDLASEKGHAPIAGAAEALPPDLAGDNQVARQWIIETNRHLESNRIDKASVHAAWEHWANRPLSPEDEEIRTRVLEELDAIADRMSESDEQARAKLEQNREKELEDRKLQMEFRSYGSKDVIEALLKNRETRDQEFNDIFAGVDATPHEFFREAFNPLTLGARYEEFMNIIRVGSIGRMDGFELSSKQQEELEQDFAKYQLDRQVRETLHDVNAILYLPSIKGEQLWDSMQRFDTTQADFAFRLPGVKEMMDLYESVLRESMANNKGYLAPESVRGEVQTMELEDGTTSVTSVGVGDTEVVAKKRFKEMLSRNKVTRRVSMKDGSVASIPVGQMADWEVDRTFTMARGMMIMTERLLSIASESRLPERGGGRITSLFLQDVLQAYSPYIHLFAKYEVGEKALSAYLYDRQNKKSFWDTMKGWNPKEMKKIWENFKKNPSSILEPSLEGPNPIMPYLTRRNPNRAGDIYTWISWRAGNAPDIVSMSQSFLKRGTVRMARRYGILNGREDYSPGEDVVKIRDGIEYGRFMGGNHPEELDIAAVNVFLDINPGESFEKGDKRVADIRMYLNEYDKWVGTGLRFERLRGKLENYEEKLKGEDNHERNEAREAFDSAEKILGRMVDLQGYRLYLISPDVRERLSKVGFIGEEMKDILGDLGLVESGLLRNREEILERGFTFDNISLDNPEFNFYGEIDGPARQQRARDFVKAMQQDFQINREKYTKEFIDLREYMHGYVLWSGDVPVDEMNAAAIGQTGFARRARDNKAQSEASVEEIKLLSNLKNIKTPEQLIELLIPIYDKIGNYDTGKAKASIAEKMEGIIKFYRAEGLTNVPVLGIYRKITGKSSVAQMMYGPGAAVWEAQDVRTLLIEAEHKDLITEEQFKHLEKYTHGSKADVAINATITIGQLATIALMLYLMSKTAKEKSH